MREGDLSEKMHWVLRNARVHALDPKLRTASGFAVAAGVHRAQVGRWEGGTVDVTHDLVRRYETLLDLHEGQLLCTIEVFARSILPSLHHDVLVPRAEPDFEQTLDLLERALSNERFTGDDWDRLSSNLDRMPHAMIRESDWEALIRRANQEIGVSLDLDYAKRYGAAVRFVRHPRSGQVVARVAADLLRDPGVQIYSDIASVLRYTTHPSAVEALLGQLREPTNDHALRAALLALTSLVPGGVLGRDVTIESVRLAIDHLRDTERPFRVRRGAANLIRAVDLPGRERLAAGLTVDNQKFAASIIMDGRSRAIDELADLQSRVRRSLEQALSPQEQCDPVLMRVLNSAIRETNEESNGNALSVLMLSPQGRVVGLTYAAELGAAITRGDHVAAHECLTVLSWLMQPDSLDQLTDLACDPQSNADYVYEAATCVGNCVEPHGPGRTARETRLRDRFAEVMAEPSGASESEPRLRGLAYALGMRGRRDLIDGLVADVESGALPSTPAGADRARSVLGWWRDLPAHIRPLR